MTDRGLHQGLGRHERLRKRSEFLRAQARGRRCSGRHLVVYAMARTGEAGPQGARLGITVSKRVGGAVLRNRVKRWVRESYRKLPLSKTRPADLVVIAKPSAAASNYRVIDAELRQLLLSIEKP